MTPLLPTNVRESDRQNLTAFMRRWDRLRVAAPAGERI
jgi:hypothetical protein